MTHDDAVRGPESGVRGQTDRPAGTAVGRVGGAFDLDQFIGHRQARWDELARLLDHLDATGDTALDRARIQELLRLYRLACSDLNQARSYTANPELLGRLNRLVGRAYRFVYQAAPGLRPPWRSALVRFLRHQVPATFQAERSWIRTAALLFFAGALVGFAAVLVDPANGPALIPGEFFSASPAERVAEIEANPERIDSLGDAAAFGSMLYTHNIQVAFLAFSAGALTIVGGWLLLFYNGLILGAVGGLYLLDGVGGFFLAWVGPHGSLELPAIVFAAAAGLRLGQALHLPGGQGRAAALREAFPVVVRILATAALVLVAAGLVEGSFSQFSAKTVSYEVKVAVAGLLFGGLMVWLFRTASDPLPLNSRPPGSRP